MKTVIVIIEIHGGCAEVICKPLGVRLIIRDFDLLEEEGCKFDAAGSPYTEHEYETKVSVP